MADAHPSAAGIIDLYRRHADVWLQRRGPGPLFEQQWLDRFRALLADKPHLLDIGCGSGRPMADYLIANGARITGVDTSGPLLAFARKNHGAPHEWIEADMRGLDLGATFDGLLAWHSFFHLSQDDQRAMFPVFARHARPGSPLMFTSGPEAGEAIGEWQGEPLHHASLGPAEYRELLAASGFEAVAHVANDTTCGGATIWLARKKG